MSNFISSDPEESFCMGWGAACGTIAAFLCEISLTDLAREVAAIAGCPGIENFMEQDTVSPDEDNPLDERIPF
jgi:hypothetical protein